MTNQKTPVQSGATEEQIEAVGQAIRAELRPERKGYGPLYLDHDVYEYENLARVAIAALSASASAHPADERHDDYVVFASGQKIPVEEFGEPHDAEEREAVSEDHAATATGHHEKLIAEARRWPRAQGVEPSRPPVELINDLADALAAPVEVDEARLAEVLVSHREAVFEWGEGVGCICGYEPRRRSETVEKHIAHAVSESLRGEGR